MGNYERYHVTAEISIATPLLTIPREQFREIMGRLNATYNEDLALYTVPLYDSHKIPSIQINLGDAFDSIYYTVPAEQLYSLYVSLVFFFKTKLSGLPFPQPVRNKDRQLCKWYRRTVPYCRTISAEYGTGCPLWYEWRSI